MYKGEKSISESIFIVYSLKHCDKRVIFANNEQFHILSEC